MPEEKLKVAGEIAAPKGSFLGLLTQSGSVKPFDKGTVFVIIGDARYPSSMVAMQLKKVTVKKIEFACTCNRPECTLVTTYTASRSGHHPQMT